MSHASPHADLATIAAYVAHELPGAEHARVAAHLRDCDDCRSSLRFLHRIQDESARLERPAPGPGHLARILAARASGQRPAAVRPVRRAWRVIGIAAAVLVALSLGAYLQRPRELLADPSHSTMSLAPAAPRMRDRIGIRYQPATGLFDGADSLVLRAVLKKPRYGMYEEVGQVQPVAVLHRGGDGVFSGAFTLPDSIVYALLAVESPDSSRVDDNDSRLWEVRTYDGPRPSFDAVRQRVHAMMGRSWEEAAASARQLGELYPDRVESWTLREFFDRALLGPDAARERARAYAHRRDSLIAVARSAPHLSYEDAGTLFYFAWVRARDTAATAADSAELSWWWTRLRREYPRHEQVAQRLALDVWRADVPPRTVLDSLDVLYRQLAPLHGPGRLLLQAAREQAVKLGSDSLRRVWMERTVAGSPDSTRRIAEFLAAIPAFQPEGIARLRALASGDARALGIERGISQDARQLATAVEDARRRVQVALGRALVAQGRMPAGIAALRLGSAGGWDQALFRDVAAAYGSAGDSVASVVTGAMIAVDPRTTAAAADSIARVGRRRLGPERWREAMEGARREMARRVAERSVTLPMRGEARVVDAAGTTRAVKSLAAGVPAVVILWSRHCGFALEAVPEINRVAERLVHEGTPVMVVVDEPPSPALARVIAERKLRVPVHYDADGSTKRAFAAFGTPAYYVLDGSGRIRFREVDEVDELLVQVAALRGAHPSPP